MRLPSVERELTIALLRRFFRTSLLVGRMPSILGREIFAARTTATAPHAFENNVVFVCDVERCLRALDTTDQRLVAFCIFEDRSEWEAARVFGAVESDTSRRLGYVLDLLYETFCRLGLLRPLPAEDPRHEKNQKEKRS